MGVTSKPIQSMVVDWDPTSDVSGTTCELLIVALLRIAMELVALLLVIWQPASHRPLPNRWNQAGPPRCVVTPSKLGRSIVRP